MRCYFNLLDSRDKFGDDTGIEVSDLSALEVQVAQALMEFMQEQDAREGFQGWRLEVTDSAGAVLLIVPLEHTFCS